MTTLTAMHWGVYEVEMQGGEAVALHPFRHDPDPSPIGLHALAPELDAVRVRRPAVRQGWLEGRARNGRGREDFVEVSWDTALDLVAGELARVKAAHGNGAIFGGSYGWSSAGRFHHAQSQIHRFLNSIGGYVRHADSYSLGAARVLMPHIVGPMDDLMARHTAWDVMAEHTQLFVTFGGVPAKNAQVSAGGASEHRIPGGLRRMAAAGCRFVNISPTRDDLDTGADVEWIAIRPNTDTALLLALCFVLQDEGLHDAGFLASHCIGFDRILPYLTGAQDGQPKNPAWAEAITGIPAARITALARDMAASRTMLNIAWALQRAHHGEQPFWGLVTLGAMLGQVGLPGGGFGLGYGATNLMGSPQSRFSGPSLPQGRNPVRGFIPVARIADMLLNPGAPFTYNGATHAYPDIRLVYWAGGNPFHHHQDLNRLTEAWARPETIVAHEQFWTPAARMADIVLPATTTLEREDIGYANRESHMILMARVKRPAGEARDDFAIFADLARRLGAEDAYTEGRSAAEWLRHIYEEGRARAAKAGVPLPDWDRFRQDGVAEIPPPAAAPVFLSEFRADPAANPLDTPTGKIEIFSDTIAGFGIADCPGHAVWREPAEWLGAAVASRHPLHLISDQPATRLHSQLDPSPHSAADKIAGRAPLCMHPDDAMARGLHDGQVVRAFNDRGACLVGLRVTDAVMPGVVRLSTGAWFDPDPTGGPERHGNPNVLTLDIPASGLSQGCIAQTCLVQVAAATGPIPDVQAHRLPKLI
ncbi:molybdopterin guanine dinucleotide-containing S/N-oxide reductase [Humitalea sp. 24SJ18S-53]|uniref:molybdopterin guanine dinucleotide-containing S/N-oxide reductase n=1 Tax=Humitalea sp. 24SJ18S-53 TaxID=3422307 RepID=UPI003D679096